MRVRAAIAGLLILVASWSASAALNVVVRGAAVDCGVPVTLPVSLSGQNGNLTSLTWRLQFDPEQVAFAGFTIDPNGVLFDYRSETKILGAGSVEITVSSSGVAREIDGLFATIALSLATPASGSYAIAVRDVTYRIGIQGAPQAGVGTPGIVTASCSADRRGRPEVYRYSPLAGSTGGGGFADGDGVAARFIAPASVVRVGSDLFVADSGAHTIRRINADGAVTTWAGAAGIPGGDDGVGGAARFNTPAGLAVMPDGSLLVADRGNNRIRRIAPDGAVSAWAGTGIQGHRDGARLVSQFDEPSALAMEPSGSLLVADSGNCTVRRIAGDSVTTLAGLPYECGYLNGQVASATFDGMSGIVSHPTLGILVSDDRNHAIRRIVAEATVLTYVGVPGEPGTADGLNAVARFTRPRGLAVMPDQSLLIATANGIRRISGNTTETIAGGAGTGWADGTGSAARMNEVSGLVVSDGVILAAELGNTTVRRVSGTFEVTTLAGSVNLGGSRDDAGPAARFNRPWQVAADAAGNLYVADRANRTIRRISPDGNVTLWAGQPGVSGGKDGPRLEATFQDPAGCVVDPSGNIWVSEPSAHVIRVIRPNGNVETVAGARGTPGFIDGLGTGSRFNTPMQLAVDAGGNVFVADTGNNAIRRIGANGTMLTVAGSRDGSAGSEGGPVDVARFNTPTGVAVTRAGSIIVADKGNHAVREVRDGNVSTILAATELEGEADGPPPGARLYEPEGVTVMPDDSILVLEASGRVRRIRETAVSTLAGRFRVPGNQWGLGTQTLLASPVSAVPVGDRAFVVSDSANDALVRATRCADDGLCLIGARFAVTLRATDPRTGASAEGLPLAENDLFGFFSLPGLTGNAANPEVFVKVLDGTGVNGKYWVFYGGLTDFELDLEVHDRLTGVTKSYEKPGLDFCGGADTGAFDKGASKMPVEAGARLTPPLPREESGSCDASDLCLRSGRFQVALSAKDPRTGAVAEGVPIPRTGDFGYFSLPGLTGNAANPEVFVKVLDGRGVNGRFWVFYGGLTDFEFTLEVTDGETGAKKSYVKPGLEFCGGADTNAF